MTSQSHGDLRPDRSFAATDLMPSIDHQVRAMYRELCSKPVPDRFVELIHQYDQQYLGLAARTERLRDGRR